MDRETIQLATTLGQLLQAAGTSVTVAESCTGGGIGAAITAVPGSSGWFHGGFITYSNIAKTRWLGVDTDLLAEQGAVSQQVVAAMAAGALEQSEADHAVAVSGVAGPDGGSPDKPVGTVWIGWASRKGEDRQQQFSFQGDRDAVRAAAVAHALQGLITQLQSSLDNRAV